MSSVIIALVEEPLPSVRVVDGSPTRRVEEAGVEYVEWAGLTSGALGPFLGFYDWLRTTHGDVVGLRLSIATGLESLAVRLPERPYLRRDGTHVVTVMFHSESTPIDEVASTEQDFGPSRAFVARHGQMLLVFDAAALTEREVAGLRREVPSP